MAFRFSSSRKSAISGVTPGWGGITRNSCDSAGTYEPNEGEIEIEGLKYFGVVTRVHSNRCAHEFVQVEVAVHMTFGGMRY